MSILVHMKLIFFQQLIATDWILNAIYLRTCICTNIPESEFSCFNVNTFQFILLLDVPTVPKICFQLTTQKIRHNIEKLKPLPIFRHVKGAKGEGIGWLEMASSYKLKCENPFPGGQYTHIYLCSHNVAGSWENLCIPVGKHLSYRRHWTKCSNTLQQHSPALKLSAYTKIWQNSWFQEKFGHCSQMHGVMLGVALRSDQEWDFCDLCGVLQTLDILILWLIVWSGPHVFSLPLIPNIC